MDEMRKIFFSAPVFALYLMLLVSCSENNESLNPGKYHNNSDSGKNLLLGDNPAEEIAIMHNEILEYHRSRLVHSQEHFNIQYSVGSQVYYEKRYYDSMITSIDMYFIDKGFSQAEVDSAIDIVQSIYQNANMFTTINNTEYVKDIRYTIGDLLNSFITSGYVSQSHADSCAYIIDEIINMNYANVDSLINEIDLTQHNFETNPSLFGLKTVYVYSKEFWDIRFEPTSSIDGKKNRKIDQTQDFNSFLKGIIVSSFDGAVGAYVTASVTAAGELLYLDI